MHSIVLFVKAGIWLAVFAAWGFNNKRLMAWIETRLAPIVFITGPGKAASLIFRLVACVFLYFSLGGVLDGVRMAKFERIAETVASSSAAAGDVDRNQARKAAGPNSRESIDGTRHWRRGTVDSRQRISIQDIS